MAASSSKHVDAEEMVELLVLDIAKNINNEHIGNDSCISVPVSGFVHVSVPVDVQPKISSCIAECKWGKSLENLPPFTMKEMIDHR